MTTLLLIIGLFFAMGWVVAILFAIREDLRDSRARKGHKHGHTHSHI